MERSELESELPGFIVYEQSGGYNIYKDEKCILTVYFQKNKYCVCRTNTWHKFKAWQDEYKLEELKEQLNFKKPTVTIENNSNVQSCIDHINRKITTIENTKPNAICLTVLRAITKELEQYK
jgi:hypothetical protein